MQYLVRFPLHLMNMFCHRNICSGNLYNIHVQLNIYIYIYIYIKNFQMKMHVYIYKLIWTIILKKRTKDNFFKCCGCSYGRTCSSNGEGTLQVIAWFFCYILFFTWSSRYIHSHSFLKHQILMFKYMCIVYVGFPFIG